MPTGASQPLTVTTGVGGVFALMLGVLTFGSEYGWGTLRTVFVQRPGRLHVFGAKLLALAVALVPFVLSVFALGTASSYAIAGARAPWPARPRLGFPARARRGLAHACSVGGVRGRAQPTLAWDRAGDRGRDPLRARDLGLISAFADQISLLEPLVQLFLRA
jgi:ABC-2 type transport system permease protein